VSDRVTVPTLLVRGSRSDIVDDETVGNAKLCPAAAGFEVPGQGTWWPGIVTTLSMTESSHSLLAIIR
jgi:hypothetical protein